MGALLLCCALRWGTVYTTLLVRGMVVLRYCFICMLGTFAGHWRRCRVLPRTWSLCTAPLPLVGELKGTTTWTGAVRLLGRMGLALLSSALK